MIPEDAAQVALPTTLNLNQLLYPVPRKKHRLLSGAEESESPVAPPTTDDSVPHRVASQKDDMPAIERER